MMSAAMTASLQPAELRAAGTDLSERRRSGVSTGPLIDIAASKLPFESSTADRRPAIGSR